MSAQPIQKLPNDPSGVLSLVTPASSALPHTLDAPPHWRTIDIAADVHLQATHPQVLEAFTYFLHHSPADAIILLGDIFEVWVGDDVLDERIHGQSSFESRCAELLRQACAQRPVFFMHGNRDFLVGTHFAQRTGVQLLADPCTLNWHGQRIVLSHGDALCLDDVEYQQFRTISRSQPWQKAILARPLHERRALGKTIRAESQQRKDVAKQANPADHTQASSVWADADPRMTQQWLDAAAASLLIHGHTHRPANHTLPSGCTRIVLSDWHVDSQVHRAEFLRLTTPQAKNTWIERVSI